MGTDSRRKWAYRRNAAVSVWIDGKDLSIGSLAGVWATENTRAAIWDAMKNRETFSTSGPRIKIRKFGGANLDRIQVIKGWVDSDGVTREKVYDVVWSGDRRISRKGKLPAVGSTVDLSVPTWTNTIGAPELAVRWEDPDFDANQMAFYYVRVLEIPTPRWTAYDRVRYELTLPDDIPLTTQERAYTSPIWYSP